MQGLEKRGRKVLPSEPFFDMNNREVRNQFKKYNKRLIKKLYPHNYIKEETHEKIINQWRNEDSFDSWTNVFIIEANDIGEARKILDSIDYCWEGYDFHSEYDCTGQAFSGEAIFHKFADRVFVVHHWQLDV